MENKRIEILTPAKTFKQLKKFRSSIYHLMRKLPNLAKTDSTQNPLLENTGKTKHWIGLWNIQPYSIRY